MQHMSNFLRGARFAIVMVEQSDDDRKFNRGQLLNIGFVEALRHADPGELISAIFHDVDLLPNDALLPWYLEGPKRGRPVHLAYPATWDKYAGMGKYEDVFFGGVTAFHPGECHKVSATVTDCYGWPLTATDCMRRRLCGMQRVPELLLGVGLGG